MDTSGTDKPGAKLILLVDDDESLLDLMDHVVKKEGFRTDRAVDGPEALRKVEALRPDLVILDMMLPGLGGYEVLRQMQTIGCGDIPIIVVTGRQMDKQGVELIRQETNVKEFMEKPVRTAVLSASLHRLLGTVRPASGGAA